MAQPLKPTSFSSRHEYSIKRLDITEPDGVFGPVLTDLDGVATGTVEAGSENMLYDENVNFLTAGVKITDWVEIGSTYYPVANVDKNRLWVSGDMAIGVGITYSVLSSPPRADFSRSIQGILLAVFHGDATAIRVGIEVETDKYSTYRATLTEAALGGSELGGGNAVVFNHGGSFISPRILDVTTGSDGSVDLYMIESIREHTP